MKNIASSAVVKKIAYFAFYTRLSIGLVSAQSVSTNLVNSGSLTSGHGNSALGNDSLAVNANTTSIGYASSAFGFDTLANGDHSASFGSITVAEGDGSLAFGYNSEALGDYSQALGYETVTANIGALSQGYATLASGLYSVALGDHTTAQASRSVVLGRFNLVQGDVSTWVPTDDLFVIGNGSSSTQRANALSVKKDGTTFISGNVGIGISAPTSKLHVVGDASITGTISNPGLSTSGSGSTSRMRVGGTVNPNPSWQGTAVIGADNQNKVIAGYLGSGTNGAVIGAHNPNLTAWADLNLAGANLLFRTNETERMRIDSSGNLGIGTTNPSGRLNVVGSGLTSANFDSHTGISWERASINLRRARGTPASPANVISGDWLGDLSFNAYNGGFLGYPSVSVIGVVDGTPGLANTPGKLLFRTSDGSSPAQDRLTINALGNVGIGTGAPTEKLEVAGNIVAGNIRTNGSFKYVGLPPSAPTDAEPLSFTNWYGLRSLAIVHDEYQTADYKISFRDSGNQANNLSYTRMGVKLEAPTATFSVNKHPAQTANVIQVNGNSLTVSSAGNVGIGTSSPTERLDVSGNAKISGSMLVGGAAVLTTAGGNGAGITNLNASNISNGSLPASRLPIEAVQLNSPQTLVNKTLASARLTGDTRLGGSAPGTQVLITSGGGVSIGTGAEPMTGYALEVNGEAHFSGGVSFGDGFVSPGGAFIMYGAAGSLEQTSYDELWLGGGRSLYLSGTVLKLNTDEVRLGIDENAAAKVTTTGNSTTYTNVSLKPYGTGKVIVDGKSELRGEVNVTGDVMVKNRRVLRVSPAGDIGMGDFMSGTNPEL